MQDIQPTKQDQSREFMFVGSNLLYLFSYLADRGERLVSGYHQSMYMYRERD